MYCNRVRDAHTQTDRQEEESSLLDLFTGAFQSFSRKPKYLKVNTPYLNGSVEGTECAVRIRDSATAITVFEGVVLAANEQGEVYVSNVNTVEEMVNMLSASRSYKNNIELMSTTKDLLLQTLSIGR